MVLARIGLGGTVPGAARLFDMVFVVVVVLTIPQAPTLPWAARKLGLITPAEPLEIDTEAAPLETMPADVLQVRIPEKSRLHGVEIFELRLPAEANLALIVRDGRGLVPQPTTTLRAGDSLLIVTAPSVRKQTERRLRAVSRAGKLAGWLGERGSEVSGAHRLARDLTPARSAHR